LIFKNICAHLEPEFQPRKEDFYEIPEAKSELDMNNRTKEGKKRIFIKMDMLSWLDKNF
jgi:hypothetical protein